MKIQQDGSFQLIPRWGKQLEKFWVGDGSQLELFAIAVS